MKVKDIFGMNFDSDIVFCSPVESLKARWCQDENRADNETIDTLLEREIAYSYIDGEALRVVIYPENRKN